MPIAKLTEQREFPFTIKSLNEDGSFSGYLSVFGNEDLGGDIVQKGAFTKTLSERKEFPLLWMHDMGEPIGRFTAEQDDKGLFITGNYILDDAVPMAKKAYALCKGGAVKGLSVGIRIIKHAWQGSVRMLSEVALMEGSVVPIPMNPLAQLTSVKSVDGFTPASRYAEVLKQFVPTIAEEIDPTLDYWVNMAAIMRQRELSLLMEFRYTIHDALNTVASEILVWNGVQGMTDDEKRALFADALRIHGRYMMTWFEEVLSRTSDEATSDADKAAILSALSPSTPEPEVVKTSSTASSDEPHTADEPLPLPWGALATNLKLISEQWRITHEQVQTL